LLLKQNLSEYDSIPSVNWDVSNWNSTASRVPHPPPSPPPISPASTASSSQPPTKAVSGCMRWSVRRDEI